MARTKAMPIVLDAKGKKYEMLSKICSSIQEKFGKESVNFLGNNKVEPIPRIPSGSRAIDKVTGGGYPLGRIIEIFGAASSGKTTACYHAIAEAQKMFPDKWCGFVDSEYSADLTYASNVGVKVDELVVAQPDSGTDAFGMVQAMVENGASLIVVDSVAAMLPREEAEEEDYGHNSVGTQARMMSKGLRKLTAIIGKHQCVVIFTNQTRSKIGVMYGNPETTSGGNALPYYASIRLKVSKVGVIEEGSGDNKEKTSVKTRIEAVKNKTYPPFKKEECVIVFGKGIDNDAGILDELIEQDIIHKKGGWYEYNGENIAQGLVNLKIWLSEHKDVYEQMKQVLLEKTKPEVEEQTNEPVEADSMTDEEIEKEVKVEEV